MPLWKRQRHERLLTAAIEILSRQPAEDLSMDQLARAAGVGKATLYRYFEGREALLRACLEKVVADLGQRIEQIEESSLPPLTRFQEIVDCMTRVFSQHFLPLRMLMRSQNELEESWRQSVHQARMTLVSVLQRNFERGHQSGDYRAVDSELLAHLVMGMIRSGVTHVSSRELEGLVAGITDYAACGFAVCSPRQARLSGQRNSSAMASPEVEKDENVKG
ncbi:TetR/AcrR family transcriptional regulator [Fodinicurvata halophila]|uniref:TetR/AcrR family transcriptional regulator n=1 Tax=Fodinicurvata halophila TaxID=1419723 RepID=UPI0036369876